MKYAILADVLEEGAIELHRLPCDIENARRKITEADL
jgi:hypothetical protein